MVDGPGDQADAVTHLAGYAGRYAASEITIGIVDETLARLFDSDSVSAACAVATEPAIRSIVQGLSLLKSLAEYSVEPSTAAFASLVRHPALSRLLQDRGMDQDVASALDDYVAERFPARMDAEQVRHLAAEDPVRRSRPARRDCVGRSEVRVAPLAEWGGAVLAALTTTYENIELTLQDDAQRLIVEACDAVVHAAVEAFTAVPAGLASQLSERRGLATAVSSWGRRSNAASNRSGSHRAAGVAGVADGQRARALIVTGFNEGLVPQSLNGDLFLPNTLRSRLGIEDNEQRYARDAYVLATLAAVRQDFRVIAGRRTSDNSPLVPSRLLFAARRGDEQRRRTLAFLVITRRGDQSCYQATCRAGAGIWLVLPRRGRRN